MGELVSLFGESLEDGVRKKNEIFFNGISAILTKPIIENRRNEVHGERHGVCRVEFTGESEQFQCHNFRGNFGCLHF